MTKKNDKKTVKKAVALQYLKMKTQADAPKVVAKGYGLDARKMEEVAKESGVPVVKDEIACNLFMGVKVGKEIPPELYKVAAEIIAYIYLLNQEKEDI
jgi:flagellar biosynthesis protein